MGKGKQRVRGAQKVMGMSTGFAGRGERGNKRQCPDETEEENRPDVGSLGRESPGLAHTEEDLG